MALRRLKAESEKKDLVKRQKEITDELNNIEVEQNGLFERSEELEESGTDEEKEELLNLDDSLEERKQQLTKEQTEVSEKLKVIEQELKTFGKGEKVDNKVETTEQIEVRDALNAYFSCNDRSMEMVRAAGLVSDDASVLIPMDIVYQPRDEIYTEQDLEQYINLLGHQLGSILFF